jgi:hypothetical protein
MGEVWLARHLRLAGKQVAIKVLRTAGQLPPDTLARFRREAEIAARLEHPNIVQVLDFNALPSGEPFLVMEYLKGESLAQRLKGGPLPLEDVLLVVRQVGAALQAAHGAGVVHRDLKPENIFLVPTGDGNQVKVLDFGISKLADSQTVQTTDSVLIGTPLYMSPEQALGNNRDVSPQSDVFSLASITYEMLTGRPPFLADSVAKVVFRIAYEKHEPLLAARPDLSEAVAQAVERALAKDRAQRTKDMATFVHELTGRPLTTPRWAEDESSGVYTPDVPVSASLAGGATISRDSKDRATPAPPKAPTPAPAPAKPSRAPWGLAAGAVVVLMGVVVAWRASQPLPVATVPDAGASAVVQPSTVDAGVQASAALDAGAEVQAASAAVDAGPDASDAGTAVAVAVPDAGRPRGPAKAPKSDPTGTPTAAEQAQLDQLQKLYDAKQYAEVMGRRAMLTQLATPAARLEGLKLFTRVACLRHEDLYLTGFITELRRLASAATYARAKAECLAGWPDAAIKWE